MVDSISFKLDGLFESDSTTVIADLSFYSWPRELTIILPWAASDRTR